MPTATLTIELPENVWVGRISRRYPDAQIRVLAAVASKEDGVVMVEFRAEDLDALVSDVRAAEDVGDVVVLEQSKGAVLAQVETSSAVLLNHVQQSGIPIEMPFTASDGETVWDLTTSHERLSKLGDLFSADGIPFTVDSITHDLDRSDLLTDAQLEVLTAAIQEGYYDTPRCCTQTELAEKIGYAKSTCSETLHRAEERIVKQFIEQHPGDVDTGSPTEVRERTLGAVASGQAD